jgi:SUKH-3 immunity protein
MPGAAESLLRDAGWRPWRSIDVSAVQLQLEARGYGIPKVLKLFIREFDGITVNFVRNGRADSIWFDAQRAISLADPEWVSHYEERTKTSLVPIGYSNHDHLMLMQSDRGGFYGAFDDFLCALGSGPVEMIANLVNQDQEPLV